MNAKILVATLLVPLAGAPAPAAARQALPLPVGATVRVASPAYTGVGTVVATSADTLRLVVEGLTAPVSLATASVARLQRRRPATALERIARGAAWGGGVMTALGLAMSLSWEPAEPADGGPDDPAAPEFVAYSALGGALWGGVIGVAIPQHRWEPVPLPVRVGLQVGAGSVEVGARVAF